MPCSDANLCTLSNNLFHELEVSDSFERTVCNFRMQDFINSLAMAKSEATDCRIREGAVGRPKLAQKCSNIREILKLINNIL